MNDLSIGECLREAGGLRAKDISKSIQHSTKIPNDSGGNSHSPAPSKGNWLSKKCETIMVVATLIATMAFQARVKPLGGVWQENGKLDDWGRPSHKAGESVMAYNHARLYRYFLHVNSIAFVSSLSTILLLISGLPFKHRLFMWGLMVIMWSTVTSIALTYGIAIYIITLRKDTKPFGQIIEIAITVWCGLMALLLLDNTIRLFTTKNCLKTTDGVAPKSDTFCHTLPSPSLARRRHWPIACCLPRSLQ
ncbi:hypothetical protein H5410_061297, partial [Solanum commersonii]